MSRAAGCFALACVLGYGSGCTVTAVSAQGDPRPSNTCESDSDCGTGNCGAGVCQAVNGQLEALLVTVSPPSDSALPHLELVAHLPDVPTSGGRKDIEIAEPAHLAGSLVISDRSGCYPTFVSPDPDTQIFGAQDGKSVPIQVVFEGRETLLGLGQQRYFARTTYDDAQGAYGFEVTVPVGAYDVYMVPPETLPTCPLPPQLRRGWAIEAGDFAVSFPVAPTSKLDLRIRWPKQNDSLKGWQLDIVEPLGGKAISTVATIGDPADGDKIVEYSASLAYSDVIESEGSRLAIESAHELLRLRPPSDVVAPTVFFDRSGLGLFGGPVVTLKELTKLPKPVTLEGRVVHAETGSAASGSVTLLSTSIEGIDSGVFASFQTTVTIGEGGVFRVDVPPGSYEVRAVPPIVEGSRPDLSQALAMQKVSWVVPADVPFQAGKLIELLPLSRVTGQSRFPGAQVRATATPESFLAFDQGFGKAEFPPRAASSLVDEDGEITLLADPGTFNISVQAPESLGFGWYVRPGFNVRSSRQDLGRVSMTAPVALSGTVSVRSGSSRVPVGSGVVRAYAYLTRDLVYTREPKDANSVVQVAETRADEQGAFRLLLPSSITAPK